MTRREEYKKWARLTGLTLGLILIIPFLSGCQMSRQTTTDLYGKARHTGSVNMLRVDDAWHPDDNQRGLYKVGQGIDKRTPPYVPLRHKGDIAGLDGPDRIVTSEDLVTVTLKSVFIKYFKEPGGIARKGEIALVLSFEAGEIERESILIYSSEGQTLGSFLDLDDMPIIGPVKIQGDDIMVRIVMIEMDQVENEERKQFIRALATTTSTLAPQVSSALSIAQPIAEFIINQNADDVILDHRFSLQRVSTGQYASRNALLFGKYVLLLQEDRLVGGDASKVASQALLPPRPDRIRYGVHSDRLYRVYNYFPSLASEDVEDGSCPKPEDVASPTRTFCAASYEGKGPIGYDAFFAQDDKEACVDPKLDEDWEYKKCVLSTWLNAQPSSKIRQQQLGYTKNVLGELDPLFPSLPHALAAAQEEGYRGAVIPGGVLRRAKAVQSAVPRVALDYPIVQYPRAFTLLAQYPLHTYLVFSVDRSLGGKGRAADARFQAFSEFLEQELGAADQTGKLATALRDALITRERQHVAFRKAMTLPEDQASAKICLLWKELSNPMGKEGHAEDVLADRAVYNEMHHITGEVWTESDEVIGYLNRQNCEVDKDNADCNCSAAAESS